VLVQLKQLLKRQPLKKKHNFFFNIFLEKAVYLHCLFLFCAQPKQTVIMKTFLLACFAFFSTAAFANDPTDSLQLLQEQMRMLDSIESKLQYKTGKITLSNGIASINVPPNFKFLEADDARFILEDVWGNLKGQTALGMLVPVNSMASIADYAFVVEYSDMGFVKDDDADAINYDELLQQLKKESLEANKERQEAGVATMSLVGWAAVPYYDKAKNVLHWAKEYQVEGSEENTLNYDVRVLGRKGVLVLQAVSSIGELDSVKQNIDPLLKAVAFTDGNKYSDFNASTDDIAAWTIGSLVAGKVLAKAGVFAFLLKFGKLFAIGGVALIGGLFKYFKRRKKEESWQPVYESKPVEESNN
jgi:uncharacterized membrane-anchored protein